MPRASLRRRPLALLPERGLAVLDSDEIVRRQARPVAIDELAACGSLSGEHVDEIQDRFGVVDVELDLRRWRPPASFGG